MTKWTNSQYDEMETILNEWFLSARASNLPVGGVVLKEKTLRIAARFNITDFKVSNGWIDRFKNRHNTVYESVCGESRSVDLDLVEDWKQTDIPQLLAGEPQRHF